MVSFINFEGIIEISIVRGHHLPFTVFEISSKSLYKRHEVGLSFLSSLFCFSCTSVPETLGACLLSYLLLHLLFFPPRLFLPVFSSL